MVDSEQTIQLASALGGDEEAFRRLIDPLRRELLVHCYRMLGSSEDAEDALQEALLRAWRRLPTFEGRASLRAWLYKIATNTCLETRERRPKRSLPSLQAGPADPRDPFPPPSAEPRWLDPFPDALLAPAATSPEAVYDARESVSLAFLAALQHLPGRQRAVLILSDVLEWRAREVAELLNATEAAVNSTLQRARATMKQFRATWRERPALLAADDRLAPILADYVHAWETADVQGLISLLREDATLTMPPFPIWFQGRNAVLACFAAVAFAGDAAGRYRLRATRANGCPGFAFYQRAEDGSYRPTALHVLTIAEGGIAEIHAFLTFDDRLFSRFGLPSTV